MLTPVERAWGYMGRNPVERAWSYVAHASGIREIESLKQAVRHHESALEEAVARRSAALTMHDERVGMRASAQRKLTLLMQRRDTWDKSDLRHFTDLTTQEHTLGREVATSLAERANAEGAAEAAQRAFLRALHDKYHAELLFSEKNKLLNTCELLHTCYHLGSGRGLGW